MTGRTHQLRVHAAHLGMPVINDEFYGHQFQPDSKSNLYQPALSRAPSSLDNLDDTAAAVPDADSDLHLPAFTQCFWSNPLVSHLPRPSSASPSGAQQPPDPSSSSSSAAAAAAAAASAHLIGPAVVAAGDTNHSASNSYGQSDVSPLSPQASCWLRLLSYRVRFTHPLTGAEVDVRVPDSLLPAWARTAALLEQSKST